MKMKLENDIDDECSRSEQFNPIAIDESSDNDLDDSMEFDSYCIAKSVSNESKITIVNEISKKETKNIINLKVAAFFILLISASCLAAGAYVYISRSETEDFEAKFGYDANKVFEAVGGSLDKTLGLLDSIAVTLVSYARDKGEVWPFVTLPDFGSRMAKLLPQTDAFTVAVLPLVTPEKRLEWEEYSIQNDQWVNQSIKIQEKWDGYYGPIAYDWEKYGIIHGDFGDIEANVSRIMLPQWQNFPVIPEIVSPYNWDWRSISTPEGMQASIDTQKSVFSDTYMIPNPNDPDAQAESEGWIDWLSTYIHPDENAFEPVMDVYYPIINDISEVEVSDIKSSSTSSNATVGLLVVSIYWREFIRGILPPGSNGIVVVVRSPCNLPFTYQLQGPDVKYLGVGDMHEKKYDYLMLESNIVDLDSFALKTGVYTGAPINSDICPYTLSIYPSDDMKSDYYTNNATVALISVILIFAFVSGVFILYDWCVERRQDKVMTSAIRSSAIVDELFPSNVRSQLYKAQDEKKSRNSEVVANTGNDQLSALGHESGLNLFNNQESIAQVYPDTTIIFADIVGFTSWSSTREPSQVFHLLETLYAGFDALAKTYGVFKIETIGDSYVAVVGLPKVRKYHAVVMARFANDCLSKMAVLTHELEGLLGPGTSNLALRVGLNSGPTTAGVLRGEKARFQLFGDTVNTAARMESNGAPNKIHVSESTAELIREAGKGDWLKIRGEQITAKGKGLMQTYWCEPVSSNTQSELSKVTETAISI